MRAGQLVSPRVVVTQLLATLQHRNWRVRQEVILLITQVISSIYMRMCDWRVHGHVIRQVVRRFDEDQIDSTAIVQVGGGVGWLLHASLSQFLLSLGICGVLHRREALRSAVCSRRHRQHVSNGAPLIFSL
jgi:hypothetical protein